MLNQIILLGILVLLSGVFSSSEIAIFTLSDIKIKHLVKFKTKNAALLEKLKKDSHKLLITILIGNNLVNIGAASLATSLAITSFGNAGIGIATGSMTLLILIFGEIFPKAFATKNAKPIALFMAPMLNLLMKLLYPFVWVFDFFTLKIIPNGSSEALNEITEEEVKGIVNLSEEQGSINKEEQEMIQNIFELDDTYAEDIMTARPDVVSLESSILVKDAKTLIKKTGFSRIPVYEADSDNIIGAIYAKDLLQVKNDKEIKHFVRDVFFVPETKKVDSLLREFKKRKIHLAIVVNEHGTMVGVITIEDLLEEIVGEIYDETDNVEDEKDIKKLKKDCFLVKGRVEIDELEKVLKINIEDFTENSTLSGFLMEKLNGVPEKGEILTFAKHDFIVENIDHNRVEEVRIVRHKTLEDNVK